MTDIDRLLEVPARSRTYLADAPYALVQDSAFSKPIDGQAGGVRAAVVLGLDVVARREPLFLGCGDGFGERNVVPEILEVLGAMAHDLDPREENGVVQVSQG